MFILLMHKHKLQRSPIKVVRATNKKLGHRRDQSGKEQIQFSWQGGVCTCACLPAWRRTPAASYITMRLKARHTGNMEDSRPCFTATAVVTPMHSDECDDGIPPESTCDSGHRGRFSAVGRDPNGRYQPLPVLLIATCPVTKHDKLLAQPKKAVWVPSHCLT